MPEVKSRDGTTIACEKMGQGAPLVLVDGAFCHRNFGPMRPLSALLAPHFTVFIYDRRGRGESGDTLPYAVEREIEDIDALINIAGGSAYVYGTSSGAALALEAAAHGLAIKKVAAYEPPYIADDSRPDFPKDYREQLNRMLSEGRRGDMVEYFMVKMIGMPAEAAAPMRHAPMWAGLEAVAHTLIYDTAIMDGYVIPAARFAAIKAPALVMNGGATGIQLINAAKAVASATPNAQYRELAGQTHDVAADAMAPVLVEFFNA